MLKNSNYDAIIFDMGGVLMEANTNEREEIDGLEKNSLFNLFVDNNLNKAWVQLDLGKANFFDFKDTLAKAYFELHGKKIRIPNSIDEWFSIKLITEMIEKAKSLKKMGYKITLLTNNIFGKDRESFLPLDRSMFDDVVESCVVGIKKPDHKIFELAMSRIGISDPKRIIFLDDLKSNTDSAAEFGFKTILVKSTKQAIQELNDILQINL